MHGIILSELKRFVQAKHGDDAWRKLLRLANRPSAVYLANEVYPDEDAVAIIAAAASMTGRPAEAIQEDFGEYIAPHLLEIYGAIMRPSWRTLDIIENTEDHVHRVVRMKNPGAKPPELRCARVSEDEVVLSYTSPRRMCAVAKGIGRGLAVHFGERLEIVESACMHRGAPACVISFKRAR
jgi:Haem-NO-binding